MIPWMRSRIAEAWHNRKSSRTAERRQSLALSSTSTGNLETNNSMHPSTGSILNGFIVKIISTNGFVLDLDVGSNTVIKLIKEVAVKHFHGHRFSPSKFRLVHATKLKQLVDNKTVQDEEINLHDELLLILANTEFEPYRLSDENIKGPSIGEVANVTYNLPIRNQSKYIPPLNFSFDFQVETRKILLTLVDSSAKLLMGSSEAPNLFQTIKRRFKNSCLPLIDSKHLQTLNDIGYSMQQGIIALYIKKNDVTRALEWLMEHQEYPADYFNFPVVSNLLAKKKYSDSNSLEVIQMNFWDACQDVFSDESTKYVEENLVNIVTILIEYFRYIKKYNFKVNRALVEKFVEMGFHEKDIVEALKVSGNNLFNACEWLLGNRESSLIDMDSGLNPNDIVYQVIMNDSQIQLSINNPNSLLVYLAMLDVPVKSSEWTNDPEIYPVFSQIFKTYHTEKHGFDLSRSGIF